MLSEEFVLRYAIYDSRLADGGVPDKNNLEYVVKVFAWFQQLEVELVDCLV